VNEELERMWKEAVVAYFKLLTHSLPARNNEIDEIPAMV
jgi:hypothetical protein